MPPKLSPDLDKDQGPSFSLGMSAMASEGAIAGGTICDLVGETSSGAYCCFVSESDIHNLNGDPDAIALEYLISQQLTVNLPNGTSCEFLPEDAEFQRNLSEGGSNPSAAVDRWAANRLNKFHEFKGWNTTLPLEEMPGRDCVMLLTKFFEQVCKKDGKLYPSQTLMGLYRAFHCILRKKQEKRVVETGKESERVFDMRSSPLFKPVAVACVLAMERSKKSGANVPRKKASVITFADEATILAHSSTSVSHSRGLQRRAVFFLLNRFCICGGKELYNLMKADFIFAIDVHGDFVKYDEPLSKNYRVSMDRYQEEHFRPAVINYDLDVVNTFWMLIHHLPVSATFLFYQCIDHLRTHAWYSTSRLGEKTLGSCLKVLHQEAGLGTDGVSNKTGRTTCISRMGAEGVPPKVGMKISGHKSEGAYERYNRSTEAKVRAALRCASDGTAYPETVTLETTKGKRALIDGEKSEYVTGPAVSVVDEPLSKKLKDGTKLLPSKGADSTESSLPSVIEMEPTLLQPVAEPVMEVLVSEEVVTPTMSVELVAPATEQGLSTLDTDVSTHFVEEETDTDLDIFFESMDWDALSCSDQDLRALPACRS